VAHEVTAYWAIDFRFFFHKIVMSSDIQTYFWDVANHHDGKERHSREFRTGK
jgi:hypothetical protein